MAFQFPDPNVTPEFTGANGITYSWDAADSKWRVKSFSDADDIFYQEDPPTLVENPNLAEGDLWVDSDDNKMYVWSGSVWSEVTACGGTAGATEEVTLPGYIHTVLEYYSSSSSLDVDDAAFYWGSNTGSLLYRKGAFNRILPELKVGDGFRVIKQDGSVLSLKVTAVVGMTGDFFNVITTTLSTGVSLVNTEIYNINFVFH